MSQVDGLATPAPNTQNASILKHLQAGFTLTPLDALRLFGCNRLAARIYELRAMGYAFHVERIEVETRDGVAYVGQYSLVRGDA